MHVFLASHSSANTPILPSSRIWYINFNLTLEQMGIDLVLPSFDMGQQILSCVLGRGDRMPGDARAYYSDRLWEDVLTAHREKGVDLFFSYYYSAAIEPAVIDRIRELGIPTVNFYCNSIHQFHLVREIAPHFDYCMFPEREAKSSYLSVGANPVHIQMAANPRFYKPYPVPREYPVTFVGQRYLNREDYLCYLLENGIAVRVWGPGWQGHTKAQPLLAPYQYARQLAGRLKRRLLKQQARRQFPRGRCGPPLSDDELVKMYSRSHISLGFSEVQHRQTGEIKRHVRLRDFEAPMSGTLYFTGYQEELAEYYEIGEEIVCYDTKEELLDKVRYYLSHESEAERMREAGLRRARRDHTWEDRFRQLFEAIGLSHKL
jgi:hypothetical protein